MSDRPPQRRRRIARVGLTIASALGFVGCHEPLGPPEQFPTATVSGQVLEGKTPVGGGWIEFLPVEGTVGKLRSARLGTDGTFSTDGVAVGQNALRLVNVPIQMPMGQLWFGPHSSSIRRTIKASETSPLRIELIEEAARHQARQPVRPKIELGIEPREGTEPPGGAP